MVLFQDKATRARLVEWNQHGTLARFEMVHFATHAILDGKAPHWSRILLGDEPLTLLDITALELNARLVTLSACSSALGSGGIGDEWIALARAFSYAGAHAVVASLWIVDDASTAALMGLFYTYLERGELIGAALRHAQLDLRARGLSAYHRAPFRAMGDV
jgi:CHAT domain-containing protein